ncbi:trypsin-like serine peptidase, partial [Streptomyces sp. NPDC058773]|uniref:trypsin-like serine peptidase n=1 Tax=Streptomyces sp. NPDC058773 TaxID=3346632 RepID=UPI0036B3DE64
MRRTARGIPAVHGIPAPHPRRPSRAALGALTAAGTLLALLLPTGQAGAATPQSEHRSGTSQTTVGAFWTAERMRAAAPLDLATPTQRSAPTAVPRSGAPLKVAPTLPRLPETAQTLPGALPQAGGPWTGGGTVVKTTGRVFFTYQGRNASCSGDAVTSGNKSTVITAGHCVKLQGAWHTNWTFVPGYHDGQAPYGKWPAAKTLSTP